MVTIEEDSLAHRIYQEAQEEVEQVQKGFASGTQGSKPVTSQMIKRIAQSTPFSSIKLMGHLDRMGVWQDSDYRGLPFPITVDIDPTRKCNSRCPACTYAQWKDKLQLDQELFRNIINQIQEIGVKSIVLTGGGEPLLHGYVPLAIKLADFRGLEIGIITNGLPLDRDLARKLLENHRLRWIRISLNAGTPEGYQTTNGLESRHFFRLIENLRQLVDLKRELGSNVILGASVLTQRKVLDEIVPAAALAKRLGLSYLQIKPFEIVTDGKSANRYQDVEIAEELAMALTMETPSFQVIASRTSFFETGKGNRRERKYDFCYGQHFATAIGADGKVYVCCHTKYVPEFEIGDLNEQSFREIWFSSKRQDRMFDIDLDRCLPFCRLHEANESLSEIKRIGQRDHLNFI